MNTQTIYNGIKFKSSMSENDEDWGGTLKVLHSIGEDKKHH